MKALYTFLLLTLLAGRAQAQVFPVDTLIKNGPVNARINLVFVGDGYLASQMPQYLADVNLTISTLFQAEPYRSYRSYFNVFAIRVPSAQAGTTHPRTAPDCNTVPGFGVSAATTYFNTAFDNGGVHRAVVTRGQAALGSVLAASFPAYTHPIVLVNSPEYGGTGGRNITMTAHTNSPEIMIHEMGHTFGLLADEYWPGPQFANERPNRTQPLVQGGLVWQAWVGQNGVGNYPFPEDPTWSRPHQNCKMRFLGAPHCSVCTETIIERTHAGARSLEGFTPDNQAVLPAGQPLSFALTLLRPRPNTLRVRWLIDGVPYGGNASPSALTVPAARFAGAGAHVVRAEVLDTTTLSRSTTHRVLHRWAVEWDVAATPTGTRVAGGTAREYEVSTYPNPVADALTLAYTLPRAGQVRLTVLDATGRRLHTLARGQQPAGKYTYDLRAEDLKLREPGVYTLLLDVDGMVTTHKLVK